MKKVRTNEPGGRRVCPICGSVYRGPGVPDRNNQDAPLRVCPDCGARQALRGELGLEAEEISEIIRIIHRHTPPRLELI